MLKNAFIASRKAICVFLMVCLLAAFGVAGIVPRTIQPARAQVGELVWLTIQVAFGAIKFAKEMFSLGEFFLGGDPTEEALEQLEQQIEQLEAIIEEEEQIKNEITTITDKLQQNNLTQEANKQIAAIQVAYGQLEQMAENGYDYYQSHPEELEAYSRNVMLAMNSMETAVEAFYQSLVVHPPGSPNCALQQARDIGLDELNGNSAASDFSTMVESTNGVNIVAERPMYFDFDGAWDGGSCQSGIQAPEVVHYFAEGTARPRFRSFICMQNPSNKTAAVTIDYMMGDGTSRQQKLSIPAHSRSTVNVHDFMGPVDGPGADFSAKVECTNGIRIIAERPMFFLYNGVWSGGHVNAGATSPSVKQYFAEGTTRPGFDSYFCIQNPDEREADVLITYMKGDGSNQQQALKVPPGTRATVKANDTIGQYDSEACDFSAVVESTNGVGLVVERPMYFNYEDKWNGGHCQGGATGPSDLELFAEGTTRPGFDSFLCLQNPEAADSQVVITYMKGDGSNQQQALTVPARSRRTVRVSDALGQLDSEACDFSAAVEVKSGGKILAERPTYFGLDNGWNGGHDEAGTGSAGHKFYFAEGTRRPYFTTYLCIQNPEDREAEVRITYQNGNGKRQVQKIQVPAKTRQTINCSQTVAAPSLLSVYEENLETLFKNSYIYQLMGAQCVGFARDYNPSKYGSTDDYRSKYYNRYMKAETEMFLACTEQLVLSQVDVSSTARGQKGVFNLPSDAQEVLARADELAQIALGEGVPHTDSDGVLQNLNMGLCGRMIASSDIVPAGSAAPPALRARVHGGSTTYNASKTELISLPWISEQHTLLSYDCWSGASPYNTLTLDNKWSIVRYRFDDLPAGSYDILDSGGNVVSNGTVSEEDASNPVNPSETYKLTFGDFAPFANTRGGPAILLSAGQWSSSKSASGSLRNMTDPTYYHTVTDTATGAVGVWMYSNGGANKTSVTMEQDTWVQRNTITAGADIDIYPHYALSPKQVSADGSARGSVSGNITILPTHYTARATYELYVTDVTTGTKTTLVTDSVTAQDDTGEYDKNYSFDYDSRNDVSDGYYIPYHMTSGHQYRFTLNLQGHNYTEIHDNSNMWCKVNQQVKLDGLRLLGF